MNRELFIKIVSLIFDTIFLTSGVVISFLISSNFQLSTNDSNVIGVFSSTGLFILLGILIVEFVSIFKISDSTHHTFFMALSIVMIFILSPDFTFYYQYVGITNNLFVYQMFTELAFIGFLISTITFFRYTYSKDKKKPSMIPFLVASFVAYISFVILSYFNLQYISHFVICGLGLGYAFIYIFNYFKHKIGDITLIFSLNIFFLVMGLQTTIVLLNCKMFAFVQGCSTLSVWFVNFSFLAIYVAFSIRTERTARLSSEYRLNIEQLKLRILVQQVKPHFIFNALSVIKSNYHISLEKGDEAQNAFSIYLRESIGMFELEKIPFSKEVDNASHYVDFVNITQTNKFNVIYSIEETDFYLPPFFLQPFIENSFKYSKVNMKED